jgi:type IV pilus assembly protein PilC
MSNFKFEAWDNSGEKKEGFMQAVSEEDVLLKLREQALTPVSVNIVRLPKKRKGVKTAKKGRKRHVKSADLASFCWQLSTMIEGGVPITDAMEIISEDTDNGMFSDVLCEMAQGIRKGLPILDIVDKYPRVFGTMFSAMIAAGEQGGILSKTLQRLAVYFENRDRLKRKIRGAMAYPIFVIGFVFLIVAALMTFIIPRFQAIFKQIEGELPAFTRAFMAFYETLMANLMPAFLLTVLTVVCLVAFNRTDKGHRFFSKLVLKIPVIGKIITQGFMAMFTKTLATLLQSGVSILDAFDILHRMSKNDVIADAIAKTREEIVAGASISQAMESADFYPRLTIKMTQVGEESGSLPEVMEKISDHYEKMVDDAVTLLTTLLEPLLIVVVGAIVLTVVLALYLPVFSLSDIKG